jgi:hypothetical protein
MEKCFLVGMNKNALPREDCLFTLADYAAKQARRANKLTSTQADDLPVILEYVEDAFLNHAQPLVPYLYKYDR